MSDLKDLVTRYLAVWNEPDPTRREQAISELWAEDGTYTDPLADVAGRAGIAAVIAGAREQFPGFSFRLAGEVDANHHIARFQWELVPDGGGEAPVVGFDVAVAAEDGRLRAVYGFLDRVPTPA
ncbi:nuclear transport factor 2 family protein [Streptomyces sp. NPDC092296]|uniref:nuclear transport factor 2 family protein n=1 Tax=Streptomyces sp. NPDC092296 TaxID=3366012 RepID=UPI003805F70A